VNEMVYGTEAFFKDNHIFEKIEIPYSEPTGDMPDISDRLKSVKEVSQPKIDLNEIYLILSCIDSKVDPSTLYVNVLGRRKNTLSKILGGTKSSVPSSSRIIYSQLDDTLTVITEEDKKVIDLVNGYVILNSEWLNGTEKIIDLSNFNSNEFLDKIEKKYRKEAWL
jgi:hypothetical protein